MLLNSWMTCANGWPRVFKYPQTAIGLTWRPSVWARAAKEGSKLNIGMVLATQAPSSVMPEILSETDNWVLSYLNSGSERRVIADYMDFADFADQIGKVSEQGFVRIRTLSQAYTVPVQLDRFQITDALGQPGQTTNGLP